MNIYIQRSLRKRWNLSLGFSTQLHEQIYFASWGNEYLDLEGNVEHATLDGTFFTHPMYWKLSTLAIIVAVNLMSFIYNSARVLDVATGCVDHRVYGFSPYFAALSLLILVSILWVKTEETA